MWFHVGQMMIIYVAGLQQIPQELYESAEIDGAGRWQQFRYVTLPMVAPATAIVMAYTTVQSFKAFDLILGLGGNPPKGSLDILSTRIYAGFAELPVRLRRSRVPRLHGPHRRHHVAAAAAVKASNPDA